jgi:hypothetical protein
MVSTGHMNTGVCTLNWITGKQVTETLFNHGAKYGGERERQIYIPLAAIIFF